MIVVRDTSAITSLLQIECAHLLSRLYQEVVIPAAVERELRHDHPVLPDFIHVAHINNPQVVARLVQEVDRGEAEAIALMLSQAGRYFVD
jgi:predicted nucleic acid-binding protein